MYTDEVTLEEARQNSLPSSSSAEFFDWKGIIFLFCKGNSVPIYISDVLSFHVIESMHACSSLWPTDRFPAYFYQEHMSHPKGGRSVQLRETAFESERLQHFPYMDLNSSAPEVLFS